MKKSKLLVLSLLAVSAIGLASCQGAQGPKGDTGDAGAPGEKGDQGTPGKDGTNGKSSLNGEGAPKDTLGSDGDSYIDYSSFDYYVKESGKWVKKGNIKGAKGETGETGEKGETGSKGEKGETGNTGGTGSRGPQGDTAWTNTILPFDYGYITVNSGSAKLDEEITFKVTITDKECVAFKILFNEDEESASLIERNGDSTFEIKKNMISNGYVVRGVGYTKLEDALKSASNISLANDIKYESTITDSSESSLFDGSSYLSSFSNDIMPLEETVPSTSSGALTISSKVNLNLNGYNIDLGSKKIVVAEKAKFNVVNTDKTEKSGDDKKVSEIKGSTETVIEVKGGASATETVEEENKTTLNVGSNVSISGTNAAIKQSGATSSVTLEKDSTVSGGTNGIELSGGSLNINGAKVESTATSFVEVTSQDSKVTSVSGAAIAIIQENANTKVEVSVKDSAISSDSSTAIYQKSATKSGESGTEEKSDNTSINISGTEIKGDTDTEVKIQTAGLILTSNDLGKVSADKLSANVGENVTLTFTPNEKTYELYSLTFNGEDYLSKVKDNKLTVKMVEGGYKVYAEFRKVIEATKDDIQSILDGEKGSIENSVIYLAEGDYETLYLRQSLQASTKREDLDKCETSYPAYYRGISNLTIKAKKGVTCDGFKTEAGIFMYSTLSSNHKVLDPNEYCFTSYLSLENIVIDGLEFNNKDQNAIELRDASNQDHITGSTFYLDNFVVQNCSGVGDNTINSKVHFFSAGDGSTDADFLSTGERGLNNIYLINNKIKNYFQGLAMNNNVTILNNLTIKGNTFEDCIGNNIQLSNKVNNGKILIENNTVIGMNGRFMRVADLSATASIEVKNNTIKTPTKYDGDGTIFKATGTAGFSVVESGNGWTTGSFTDAAKTTWQANGDTTLLPKSEE